MDKALILKRIKLEKNFKTDTELADFLGISKATLSNWYKRDTIDYDLVLSKCEHMDLNFLIRGDKEVINSEINLVDNTSIGFFLDRCQSLAVKIAFLEKENEELRFSRGKSDDPSAYIIPAKKINNIAAEPIPNYTRKTT